MADEPKGDDPLSESLQLLANDVTDYSDFAIDSDDEEQGIEDRKVYDNLDGNDATVVSSESPPTVEQGNCSNEANTVETHASLPNSTAMATNITPLKKQSVTATEDPLSAQWVAQPKLSPLSSDTTNTNSTNGASHIPPSVPQAVGANMANLVSKTQSFTSSVSSFASKAANSLQDAVNNASRVPNNNASFSNTASSKLIEKNTPPPKSVPFSKLSGGGQKNTPTIYNSSKQKQNQDMDNVMKTALIKSAMGKLLTGERVIVFLPGLVDVRDSSSSHTGVGSSFGKEICSYVKDIVWCCVVTYYRLLIFSYQKSDFLDNADRKLSSMDSMTDLADCASISRQHQHSQSIFLRRNEMGNRHYVIEMPLASIERVSKLSENGASSNLVGQVGFHANLVGAVGGNVISPAGVIVHGKDNNRFIQFSTASYADCARAIESITTFAFPGKRNIGYLFAFESRRSEFMASVEKINKPVETSSNEPKKNSLRSTSRRYDALVEFQRMGALQPRKYSNGSDVENPSPWKPILRANSTYSLCPSYPSILFGPASVDEDTPEGLRMIRETAVFRSGARMQTLSWASRYDGASLWRSGQPKVGLQGNRSQADELYMKRIAEGAALANSHAVTSGKIPKRPDEGFLKMLTGGMNDNDLMIGKAAFNNQCMLKIVDLRPKSSAMANRTAGYGYENTSHYKNSALSFHGIGNIHAVRDSYQKLNFLCTNSAVNDAQWGQLVEETKWLNHIRLILSASWQVAFHINYNRLPVLVHCSHGWDRTSQVCALVQLLLDPFYRTRTGFSCLVEKEFLALGHPFHTRSGHGEGRGEHGNSTESSDEGQISPIFVQFLDCVYQIVNQYPDYFEFNTKYLLLLSEHVYSCRFGTLLCDTEREREVVASIRQRTPCLWEYLDSFQDLINKHHSSVFSGEGKILMMPLPTLLRNVTLWTDRHCMHGPKPTLRCLPTSIPTYETELPLHRNSDLNVALLEDALAKAHKWEKIAHETEKELQSLKTG